VWQNEPAINRQLLGLADIATPHIAGYSVNGKYNATNQIVKAVSNFFLLDIPPIPPLLKDGLAVNQNNSMANYDIMADDRRLRESPETFEQQRNNYPERWEFRNDV
jgi:erythronate-4-phosphate dehydrogenase